MHTELIALRYSGEVAVAFIFGLSKSLFYTVQRRKRFWAYCKLLPTHLCILTSY